VLARLMTGNIIALSSLSCLQGSFQKLLAL
jgi:hypothetical protein